MMKGVFRGLCSIYCRCMFPGRHQYGRAYLAEMSNTGSLFLSTTDAPAPLKAPVTCKTPQFWYVGLNPSDTVRVYALPAAAPGRWEANTTITTVDRLSFYLQNLSGSGGSGGAVVTTKTGSVIGYMGGAFDVEELDKAKKKVERRFNSYAFTVHALPWRLSSPPTSRSQGLVAVAGKTER